MSSSFFCAPVLNKVDWSIRFSHAADGWNMQTICSNQGSSSFAVSGRMLPMWTMKGRIRSALQNISSCLTT